MPGIRIRHHTRRSQLFPVPLFKEVLPNWHLREECRYCHEVHRCKVVHLTLDAEGCDIITAPLWQKFQTYPNWLGFRVANEVTNPPVKNVALDTLHLSNIIDGVDVGGILAEEPDSRQEIYFDMGGNGAGTTRKGKVDLRTVSIDEYFELMARNGVGADRAANILMKAFLKDGPTTRGAQ